CSIRHLLLFLFLLPATTVIYTLSLHDALPICRDCAQHPSHCAHSQGRRRGLRFSRIEQCRPRTRRCSGAAISMHSLISRRGGIQDRKSTRLNSSHRTISYAVFCLKKKTEKKII